MPRVLRILNRLIIGGPSKNAVYLTRYLQPEFETMLVIGSPEGHEQDAEDLAREHGIKPVIIPDMKRAISPAQDWKAYRQLKKLIRDFRPDIVHTHAAKSGALGRLAAYHSKVPVIVHTFHGHVFHSYFNSAKTRFFINTERYLGRITDSIIAISDIQKKELVSDFRIAPEHKFSMIPLGLDLDPFTKDQGEKRSRFRTEFGISQDTVVISIIGRLVPVKNHSLFLKALKIALEHAPGNIKAFIIGDGESRASLEQEARGLGISYSVENEKDHPHSLVFTSWRTDIAGICAGSDIIALTSLNEGTPVSLIEAQAAGRPVVSTRVGGIEDVVIENKTAFLSDATDPKQFAEHLLMLIRNKELRTKHSQEGRDFVLRKFGYQRLISDMSGLYNRLLKKKLY